MGSARISRGSGLRLRGILFQALLFSSRTLRTLGAVLGARLLPARYTCRIERSPNHVIAHTRKVFYTAAADQYDRVLLQVVADTRYIGRHFNPVGQPDSGNFSQRRVGLFGRRGVHASA